MRSALVTGASTGIGRATALRLDGDGWRVFAGVRREEDAESLRAEGSERLTPVMLDVTDAEAIAAAAELLESELGERRPRRPRQQRRDRRSEPAGDDPYRGLPPPDRGQPDRAGRGHPGAAAADPPRPRTDRLHQLDRRSHRLPADRRLPRGEVGGRGGGRRLPPGAAALGDLGFDRRARLDRYADLGPWRAGSADEIGERTPHREELYGKTIDATAR